MVPCEFHKDESCDGLRISRSSQPEIEIDRRRRRRRPKQSQRKRWIDAIGWVCQRSTEVHDPSPGFCRVLSD